MSSNNPKILIIGAGITGSLCAYGLKSKLPNASISLFDKGKGAGGRMSTARTDIGNKADLGAQYITSNKSFLNLYNSEYQSLLSQSIIQPFTANIRGMKAFSEDTAHFIAPGGMSKVVGHFLKESDCPVTLNRRVADILKQSNQIVVNFEEGSTETCDVLISTMPVPQFVGFTVAKDISPEIQTNLQSVSYSTRFVLIFYYDKNVEFSKDDLGTSYLDDEIFRFVSFDNLKRNQPDEPASIIFHTNVNFGDVNKTKDKSEMESVLVAHAKSLFPNLPAPVKVRCHKWLYSQVVNAYPNTPGCINLSNDPLLVLAGDAFSNSTFNGCVASARAVVEDILSKYGNKVK